MRNALMLAATAATLLVSSAAAPRAAQKTGPHEPEFRAFYADFLSAVKANDKEKIADMIAYPVSSWSIETKGNVEEGQIKDKADFLARYNVLFTSSMRLHVQKAKVEPIPDGWFTSWKTSDTEFSFEFRYVEGSGFKIESYSIGPL